MRKPQAIGAAAALFIGLCSGHPASALTPPSTPGAIDCVSGSAGAICNTTLSTSDVTGYNQNLIAIAGYNAPQDGGGGIYKVVGPATTKCPSSATPLSGTVSVSNLFEIDGVTGASSYRPGSIVTSTLLGPYAQIASVTSSKIFLTIPANSSGAISFNITGKNDGTILSDGAGNCLVKVNYRGDPHEWGAHGDNSSDDTIAMQKWVASAGPWEATLPASYLVNKTITCWDNRDLKSPANDAHAGLSDAFPIVAIRAATSFTGSALMQAQHYCRISGLELDANNLTMTNSGLNTLFIAGGGVVIDSHSLLANGNINLDCDFPSGKNAGMQVKDSQIGPSWSDNVYLANCPNVRLIGDVIAQAGKLAPPLTGPAPHPAGVYSSNDDLTIANGVIEESVGTGLFFSGAHQVSVTGEFIDDSGDYTNGSSDDVAGLLIDTSTDISICGNHFNKNGQYGNPNSAHVRFSGASDNISFCGNVYQPYAQCDSPCMPTPEFVYDVVPGSALTHVTLYEAPIAQTVGVFTSRTGSTLTNRQVCPTGGC